MQIPLLIIFQYTLFIYENLFYTNVEDEIIQI